MSRPAGDTAGPKPSVPGQPPHPAAAGRQRASSAANTCARAPRKDAGWHPRRSGMTRSGGSLPPAVSESSRRLLGTESVRRIEGLFRPPDKHLLNQRLAIGASAANQHFHRRSTLEVRGAGPRCSSTKADFPVGPCHPCCTTAAGRTARRRRLASFTSGRREPTECRRNGSAGSRRTPAHSSLPLSARRCATPASFIFLLVDRYEEHSINDTATFTSA